MKATFSLWVPIVVSLSSVIAQPLPKTGGITAVEAIHLLERRLLPELDGKRLVITSVDLGISGQHPTYLVSCRANQDGYQATVDAQAARLTQIRKNGEPFYEWPGPLVVGHRGNVKFAPENTIPAFEVALRYGADLIEIDVRQTRDAELVIIHDETVDRTTDGTGKVADLALKQLKGLDAGSWFDSSFEGVRIPTLRETLRFLRGKALPDIDFKAGDPERLIALLREEGFLPGSEEHSLEKPPAARLRALEVPPTLYCGDWDLLRQTRALTNDLLWRPTVPIGEAGLPVLIHHFDPPIVNVDWKQFSEGLIRSIHLAGKRSFLNTMKQDTELAMRAVIETAPDYIQSDHIDILMPLLRARGLHR